MGVFKARVFSKKRHRYRVVLVFKQMTKWVPVVLIFGLMASSCALADITSAATEPSDGSQWRQHCRPLYTRTGQLMNGLEFAKDADRTKQGFRAMKRL